MKKSKHNINNQISDILNNKIFTSNLISGLAGDKKLSNKEDEVINKIIKK